MSRISALYQICCSKEEIQKICRDVVFEQTVEVPEELVTSQTILEEIVGRVEWIKPVDESDSVFRVQISYHSDLASKQIPQLLNLLYGNISIKKNIRLVDVELPEEFLCLMKGPKFGSQGIRSLVGVEGRPLLATALKPRGATNQELASIAESFSLGGGDIIKDDHNLVEAGLDAYRERVLCIREAVQRANEKTGRRTLYFPNLMVPVEELDRYAEFLLHQGIPGILVSPFVMGFDVVRRFSERYPLILMAHPAFSGAYYFDSSHGIDPGLLLGKLLRLIGADCSIFPNYGGRFSLSAEQCRNICHQLSNPWGKIRPAFPTPAGGMSLDRMASMAEEYGEDCVYLIGGALLAHSQDLQKSTEVFLERIGEYFPESRRVSPKDFSGSCDWFSREEKSNLLNHLIFRDDYTWQGRQAVEYKSSEEIPFQGVQRHELIGPHGERTAFDLRYFQVEPGGFTSLEKHLHTHTVICLQGSGVLVQGDRKTLLKPYDIVYISPMEVHQLRNESAQPFGFFCIVDHDRDQPMKP